LGCRQGCWIKQQWKELTAQLLSGRHGWDAIEQRLVAGRLDAVATGVDDDSPARSRRRILVRAVYHQRMMERALSLFQFDRNWLELFPLFFAQHSLNRVHVAG